MALIKCTECNNDVSDKAKVCIHCGYPLEEIVEVSIENKNIDDAENENVEKIFVITNCFRDLFLNRNRVKLYYSNQEYADYKGKEILLLDENKNRICESRINFMDSDTLGNFISLWNDDKVRYNDVKFVSIISENVAKKKREALERANSLRYNNEIKCPTCSSTNVTRVSTGEKITNIALFGLFGNKRKMQFTCNNCKYMW